MLKINKKLVEDIENASNLLIEKPEMEMYFKQIYVKIVKTVFEKSSCHGNGLIGASFCFVFLDRFYEKTPNFVAVAVLVAKIRIFEISAGTLCLLPCKIGQIGRLNRRLTLLVAPS